MSAPVSPTASMTTGSGGWPRRFNGPSRVSRPSRNPNASHSGAAGRAIHADVGAPSNEGRHRGPSALKDEAAAMLLRRVQQVGWHLGPFQDDEMAGVRDLREFGGGEQPPIGLPV